jgi:hypothetical protein
VTRVPPERPAARALEESFRRLGDERVAALEPEPDRVPGRRRRRPRGATRTLVAALTLVLLVAVAATGTKVFLGDGGSVAPEPDLPTRYRQAPADRQLAAARAADPSERIPWGLRVYRGATGTTCAIAGRVVGDRLGDVRDGRFAEIPTGAPGLCGALEHEHVLVTRRRYPSAAVPGGRTVLYGVVDRTVRSLQIAGGRRAVPIAADGTFIVVAGGVAAFRGERLVVRDATGRHVQPLGS